MPSIPLTLAFTLALALALTTASASPSLLLVVGDVSPDSGARILYQCLHPAEACPATLRPTMTCAKGCTGDAAVDLGDIVLTPRVDAPQIWVVPPSALSPGAAYSVELGTADNVVHFVVPLPKHNIELPMPDNGDDEKDGESDSLIVLALSCDRWLEDGDDVTVAELAGVASENPTTLLATIHMGDQIYADNLVSEARVMLATGRELPGVNHWRARFAKLYLEAWSRPTMAALLRTGIHWMLPDDHDIVNNLDPTTWDARLAPLVRGGIEAYLEYQAQLLVDVPWLATRRRDLESLRCTEMPPCPTISAASPRWQCARSEPQPLSSPTSVSPASSMPPRATSSLRPTSLTRYGHLPVGGMG